MAKSKRGPSLFEKLERTEGSPRSPRRTRLHATGSATRDGLRREDGPPSPQSLSETPDAADEPLVSFDGDHLRFSFSSGYAALVIFVAVGFLIGAYWLGGTYGRKLGMLEGYERGRNSYRAEVADEIETARGQEPATELVRGLTDGATSPTSDGLGTAVSEPSANRPAQADVWVSGLTYVVVQEFSAKNAAHVETAQRFLAEQGIETAAVRMKSGSTQLITKQGYNRRDATQRQLADKFLEKVHAAGKSYYASGGGYRLEGYFKLRRDRW